MKKNEIPIALDHVRMISLLNKRKRQESEIFLKKYEKNLSIFGTSLSALYKSATCYRKCHGGGHLLERIIGRAYNLACASYCLISIGFYDEAMNLVRSIGEIANLISLSVSDKVRFQEWINADKRKRLRDFTPAKIRKYLKSSGLVIMDDDWYSELYEKFTHISIDTNPNYHKELDRAVVGGMIQENALEETIEQLVTVVSVISLFVCKYFDYDDLLEIINSGIDGLDEN